MLNFILIKRITLGIGMLIICFYGYLFIEYVLGLPKAYNDLMKLIIKHKDDFQDSDFCIHVENDFKNRNIPFFILSDFKFKFYINSEERLNDEDKRKILYLYDKLKWELESKVQRGNEEVLKHGFRVKPYIHIPIKWNLVMLIIFIMVVGSYLFVSPLADQQLLNEYKKAGIESLDDRYVKESESLEVNAEIINKSYKGGVLGGAYYKIEVKIEELEKTFVLEVDPYLYQKKKVKEFLSVKVNYTKEIDRFKDTENITINDISILE